MPFASGLFGRSDALMTSGANATKNVNSYGKSNLNTTYRKDFEGRQDGFRSRSAEKSSRFPRSLRESPNEGFAGLAE